MTNKINKNFKIGKPLVLPNRAIMIPLKKIGSCKDCLSLAEFAFENRWENCRFQGDCINMAILSKIDGFSCKECPFFGKPENEIKPWEINRYSSYEEE